MAAPFNDVTKDIPGYKIILKSVLKSQIQHLVEQLAANTDEESVILTASVSDGTLSHLGSESGNDFLRDHEDIKLQFLGFCLKNHYERRLETQRQETETCSQDSKTHFISNFEDKDEIYTATTFIAPQTSDSIHNVTAKSTSCRSPARSPTRSPRARFEPYMSSKRSRKYLYSLQQDRYRSHVFGQSVFNVPIENIDEENVDTDESRKEVETTKESTAFRFSGPNLKNESGYISDQTLTKCDNDSKFNESDNILKPDNENPNFGQTENDMDEDIDNEDASTCITPVQQCDGSGISISITEANQNQTEISQTKEVNENIKILNVEKNAKRIMVEPDLHRDRENLKAENSVTKRQIKTTVNKRHDENTKETLVIQDTDETSGNSSVSVKSKGYQNIYFDNGESYVSRLRSSRSLRRKVEVNNALKLSHAKRASRRGAGRDNHARVSHTLSMDNVVSNTYDISTTNTESENENLELLEKGRCSIKIEDEEDPLRNTQCKKQKIFDKETEEDRKQEHGTKEQKTMNPELFKQETNSDSESELEIIAIEPGSVFLFKDSLSKLKGPEDTVAKQKKVFIKRGSKLGIKRKKKSTGENVKKVFPKTTSYTKGALSPPSPYVAKLRRFKTSVSKIEPCSLSPKCSNRKPSERLPITKKADHNSIKEHSAGPSTKRAELNVEPISETQISSTQNLNSDEDGELEIPDVDEPDSSNLSDVKSNKLNIHFIEEDTPSPVSLSNSYMESEDNNDELTSDSSVSYTRFSKFAMGTNHTKQDPVSKTIDSNVYAKLKRLRSNLNLHIAQIRSDRTKVKKDKWGTKTLKTKKLPFPGVASRKGIRLAKQQKKQGINKHKDKRKLRKLLKLGINEDPKKYRYTVASSTDSSYSQSNIRIPSTIFTKKSLDLRMKSLTLSNDEQSTQTSPTIKYQSDCNEHGMPNQEQTHFTEQDLSHEFRPVHKRDTSSEETRSLDLQQEHVLVSMENRLSNQKHVTESKQNRDPKSEQQQDSEPEQTQVCKGMALNKQPDVYCNIFEKFTPGSFYCTVFDPKCSLITEDIQLKNESKHLDPKCSLITEDIQLKNESKHLVKTDKNSVSENHDHILVEKNVVQTRESNNVRDNDANGGSWAANPPSSDCKMDTTLSDIFVCTSEINCVPSSLLLSRGTVYDRTMPQSNGIIDTSYKIGASAHRSNFEMASEFQSKCNSNANATGHKQSVLNGKTENKTETSQSRNDCPVNNPFIGSSLLISSCLLNADKLFQDKQRPRSSKESSTLNDTDCKKSHQLISVPDKRQRNNSQLNSFDTGQDDSSNISASVVKDNSRSITLPSITDSVTLAAGSAVTAVTSSVTLSLSSLMTSSCSLPLSVSTSLSPSLSSSSSSHLTSYLSSPVPSLSPTFSTSSSSLSSPLIPKYSNVADSEISDVITANNNNYHIQSTQQDSNRNSEYQQEDFYIRTDQNHPVYIDNQCHEENIEDGYFEGNLKIKREEKDILIEADGQNKKGSLQESAESDFLGFKVLEQRKACHSEETERSEEPVEICMPNNNIRFGDARTQVGEHVKESLSAETKRSEEQEEGYMFDKSDANNQEETSFSEYIVTSKYKCDTCGMIFQSKSILTEHMASHTGKIKHVGAHAGEVGQELLSNERQRADQPVGIAEPCTSKKKKGQRKYLMENRSIFRPKKSKRFTCTYCGKKYSIKSGLEKHISCDHVRDINLKCQVCGSRVEKRNADISINGSVCTNILDNGTLPVLHSSIVNSGSDYSSVHNDCGTHNGQNNSGYPSLSTDKYLSAIRNVSNDANGRHGSIAQIISQKYATVCEKCKYLLKSDTDLQADNDNKQVLAEKHTPVKNESEKDVDGNDSIGISKSCVCDLCEKTFPSECSLKGHVHTVHYGELFKCKMCRKTFTMEESFLRHTREIHDNKRSDLEDTECVVKANYHCGLCGLPFTGSRQLRIHMAIVHSKKRFKCHKCQKTFSYKACLKRHVQAIHS